MPGVGIRLGILTDTRHPIPGTQLKETNHFINLGYGWLCKHCSAEEAEGSVERGALWRLFGKDNTQKKMPQLPSLVLARWTDSSHKSLACPRCAMEELI